MVFPEPARAVTRVLPVEFAIISSCSSLGCRNSGSRLSLNQPRTYSVRMEAYCSLLTSDLKDWYTASDPRKSLATVSRSFSRAICPASSVFSLTVLTDSSIPRIRSK